MNPYAKAADEILRRKTRGAQAASTVGSIAGIGLKGSALASGIRSFLNPLIPSSLSAKGLGKINPLLKKFFNEAEKRGYNQDEVLEHIRENMPEPKEAKSIFQEIIGDVDVSTLDPNIQNQLGFLEMATEQMEKKGIGRNDPAFKKLAKKIKDVLKGKGGLVMEEIGRSRMQPQSMQEMQPQPTQGPQEGQQIGPGQEALLKILQQIQASRGQQ